MSNITYNKTERLRFWCQKVLPIVYDDSLSYYELLNKVVVYLNSTIEDVQAMIEDVTRIEQGLSSKIDVSQKGVVNGVATLDGNGHVPLSQLPDISTGVQTISVNGVNVPADDNKNVNIIVMTNAVSNLVNYYLKAETYNKTEVNALIDNIKNSRFEVVAQLPTTDIQTNVIYLVAKSVGQTQNGYDEFINIDGTTSGWELIGSTDIDLSGYVTTDALNTALGDKLDITRIAPEFRDDVAYTTGQYVTRNGFIYRFKNNHSAGAFNPQEVFDVTIGDVLADKEYITSYDSGDFLVITGEDSSTGYTNNTVSLNKASTPTQSDTKPITSSGVYNYAFPRSEQAVLGAKNLLAPKWQRGAGTGITFTVNSDGTVTANGTAVGDNSFFINTPDMPADTPLVLNGCPSGGSSTTYLMLYSNDVETAYFDYGDGVNITKFNYTTYENSKLVIRIKSGQTVNNLVFKPMIRLATDPDSTFAPYAMTNRELSEIKTETLAGTISGATIVAESKYRSIGKVCWVYVRISLTESLSQGGRITISNSNLPKNTLGAGFVFSNVFNQVGDIAWLDSDSKITFQHNGGDTIPSGNDIQFSFCYPIA